jgi:hypothetical protein
VKDVMTSLSEPDLGLVRETQRARLLELDEDALLDVHRRVRRARNKHVGIYRRAATDRVEPRGGRGIARPENRRNAERAEVFEDALARVSRRLAVAARDSAAELKAERLDAARKGGTGPTKASANSQKALVSSAQKVKKSPARKKRDASTLAAGARRQAKRDSK